MKFNTYTISVKGFFRKSYQIYEDGILRYEIKSPGFFAYREIEFYKEGAIILKVHRPMTFGGFRFEFKENNREVGTLHKDMISNTYRLDSAVANYRAEGAFFGGDYTIFLGDEDIAIVSVKTFSTDHKYGIAIIDGNHDLYILAMVVMIDVVKRVRAKG